MEEEEEADAVLAEKLRAAEVLMADVEPWNVFDCRRSPQCEFDTWLENNMPSRLCRTRGKDGLEKAGWICVVGANYSPADGGDVPGLQDSWERLLDSGRPAIFQAVRELALNHGVLAGKWLMHLEAGFKLDHAWEGVARAALDGRIPLAKVALAGDPPGSGRQVICVYNRDFTDESQVVGLDAAIRATGVKCPLYYKPTQRLHPPGHLPGQPLAAVAHHLREPLRPGAPAPPLAHPQQSHRPGAQLAAAGLWKHACQIKSVCDRGAACLLAGGKGVGGAWVNTSSQWQPREEGGREPRRGGPRRSAGGRRC